MADPAGSGEELTSSTHNSRAASRAAFKSPLPALSQIPSILAFALEESVEADCTPCLHAATACCTAGLLATAGTVVPPAVVLAAAVVVLWLVEVELLVLLLLPQPATSTPPEQCNGQPCGQP